jgi:hypothetical protein
VGLLQFLLGRPRHFYDKAPGRRLLRNFEPPHGDQLSCLGVELDGCSLDFGVGRAGYDAADPPLSPNCSFSQV